MQWGKRYRVFHESAWREAFRVLKPGDRLIVIVSDHIRNGEVVPVVRWHMKALAQLGFVFHDMEKIETPRYRNGPNSDALVRFEQLVVFETPAEGSDLGG